MVLNYSIGLVAILIGIIIIFLKIDKEKLKTKTHTNPMLALYRFKWWQYGQGILFILFGILWVSLKS